MSATTGRWSDASRAFGVVWAKIRRNAQSDASRCDPAPRRARRRGTTPDAATPQAIIEHVDHRAARQPVVEVAEHHDQRVPDRIEIVEDLPHLESPLADSQSEMRREDVHLRAPHVHGRRQGAARLAALHGQVDTVDFDDRMPREQRVAEALRDGLPRRAQRTLVAVQRREHDGLAASRAQRWPDT